MALRKNDLGGDSLALAAQLTGITTEELIADPAASIDGAAAVLNAYADEADVDRSQGHRGLAPGGHQVRRPGRGGQQVLRHGRVRAADRSGSASTNSYGETFAVSSRGAATIDLASLVPPGMKRIPLEALEAGHRSRTRWLPSGKETARSGLPRSDLGPGRVVQLHRDQFAARTRSSSTRSRALRPALAPGSRTAHSQVSSHYVVSEAGGVWQCVVESYKAWHVGCLNTRSIGIEHEGYASSPSHPAVPLQRVGTPVPQHLRPPRHRQGTPHLPAGHPRPHRREQLRLRRDALGSRRRLGLDLLHQRRSTARTTRIRRTCFGGGTDGWTTANGASRHVLDRAAQLERGRSTSTRRAMTATSTARPPTSAAPWAPQTVNVDFYPQNGNTAAHDMQLFWKTNAENFWDAPKSTPVVNYTAQNAWATVNLSINNAKWWGQTINQLRLDFDQTNHGNRWIINHVVLQNAFWWHFDTAGNVMGWTAGNSLTAPWQTSGGWPGILVTDQTGNDGHPVQPVDQRQRLAVQLPRRRQRLDSRPRLPAERQLGRSTTWPSTGSIRATAPGTRPSRRTSPTPGRTSGWMCICPVGQNPNWPAAHVTQLRLDFDQANHGTRWLVDYITTEYGGTDSTGPERADGPGGDGGLPDPGGPDLDRLHRQQGRERLQDLPRQRPDRHEHCRVVLGHDLLGRPRPTPTRSRPMTHSGTSRPSALRSMSRRPSRRSATDHHAAARRPRASARAARRPSRSRPPAAVCPTSGRRTAPTSPTAATTPAARRRR